MGICDLKPLRRRAAWLSGISGCAIIMFLLREDSSAANPALSPRAPLQLPLDSTTERTSCADSQGDGRGIPVECGQWKRCVDRQRGGYQCKTIPPSPDGQHVHLAADLSSAPKLSAKDDIYSRRGWDYAPVVIEEHKLIFFTVPKVACTVFKQLLRRMMGFADWEKGNHEVPHNPAVNGLKYLHQWSIPQAETMMLDPSWTKAIFLREPHEKFLSAYLDKAVLTGYVRQHCRACPPGHCNFGDFISVTQRCRDRHWGLQSKRVDAKWWPYINFVGLLDEHKSNSVRAMLSPAAWEEFGASGWGRGGNHSIFQSNSLESRATGAAKNMETCTYQ